MLEEIIGAFLLDRTASGCTEKTIAWHTTALGLFARWLEETDHPTDPEQWTPTLLRAFIVDLQTRPSRRGGTLSGVTVQTYVGSLLAFTRWLHEEEYTEVNVGARVKKPKRPQTQPQPFTDGELRALLKATETGGHPLRDRAMLCLLLDCGLRASEVTQLRAADVLVPQQLVVVRQGKGRKDRVVPFSADTAKAIRRYLRKPLTDGDDGPLFPSDQGGALRVDSLRQLLVRTAKRARVAHVHPHRFRHTFAVSFLRNGGDPLTLQRLLGHTSLAITNIYVNLNTADLSAAHAKASPLHHILKRSAGPRVGG